MKLIMMFPEQEETLLTFIKLAPKAHILQNLDMAGVTEEIGDAVRAVTTGNFALRGSLMSDAHFTSSSSRC